MSFVTYCSFLIYKYIYRDDVFQLKSLPPVVQIQHEAIESLLNSSQYDACLELCNKVLASYSTDNSQDNSETSQIVSSMVEEVNISVDDSVESGLQFGPAATLMWKAKVLVKLKRERDALFSLQRCV